MKRREFIKSTSLSTAGVLVSSSMLLNACHTEEDMKGEPNWIVEGGFDRPLVPPSVVNGNVQLVAQTSTSELLKGKMTNTLSYSNGILGPVIKATAGETISVQLQNNLSEETNIHWHGLAVPADMDGHPMDVAQSGGTISYNLPIYQRAGTYWYHPHPHGLTAKQVFNGLAGMFIVNDAEEFALNLPSGEFEILLAIQDKRFSGSNLDYSPTMEEIMIGYLGEQVVVNGIYSPYLNVASGWYRLRLLNGSTARVYNLAFSGDMQFYIVGSDGGLLSKPERATSILLGPGERADVLVNFNGLSTGKEVFLVSKTFSKYNAQGRQQFSIMKFNVDRTASQDFSLPASLSVIERLSPAMAVKTRTFDIGVMAEMGMGEMAGGEMMPGMHTINGKLFDMERVDETVQAGSTEIWEFDNMMGDEIHPMHIHGVQFQVVERVGGRNEIIATEKGWKDTMLVMPGEKVSVIMTFPQYKGKFVFHCHNLEHEDDGMMLNYEII